MNRPLIWIGAAVGSTVGGLLPLVWHVSAFSFTSIFFPLSAMLAGLSLPIQSPKIISSQSATAPLVW